MTNDAFSRFFEAFSQIEHINFIKFIFSPFNFSIKNGVFSRFLGTVSQIELVDFTLHKPQGFVVKALAFHACHPDTPTTEFKTLL
ncbi:MAG: hypothetical protein IJS21_00790 [Deltaproteobacteria bacterium]|nr:hypothetical protein [Deltaproteobacteria bacterium]